MWGFGRIAIGDGVATNGIRGDKPFITFAVGGRRAVAGIHVAAADPFGAGCHADGVGGAGWPTWVGWVEVVADHGAHGVGTVAVVVARFGGIGAAATAGDVDGIVPVVVVVGGGAVPTAILVDEGGVVPVVAGILAADDGTGAGDTSCPDVGRIDKVDVPFNGLLQGSLHLLGGSGQAFHGNGGVGDEAGDVVALGECLDECDIPFNPDHVEDPILAVRSADRLQVGDDGGLGLFGYGRECLVDVGAFFVLGRQGVGVANIPLFC